ncbi:LYR motif-containing protein 1-like, partial [Acipenser oxyrinchus oxyrinchus]
MTYHSVAIKTSLEWELLIQIFLVFMSQSVLAQETDAEKKYIVQEASTLFRQNMDVRMQNIKILTDHQNVCQLNRAMNSDTTNSLKTGCPVENWTVGNPTHRPCHPGRTQTARSRKPEEASKARLLTLPRQNIM